MAAFRAMMMVMMTSDG